MSKPKDKRKPRPTEVEARKWAIERAMIGRSYPYAPEDRRRLAEVANALVAYVLTGIEPPGDSE